MSSSTDLAVAAVTPMDILQRAAASGASIEQLQQLMALQERWEANEARKAFNASMARFKANPPRITKNRHVKFGQTEYDHATLDHVTNVITGSLSAVGISHRWSVKQEQASISVSCILTHEQGHSETVTMNGSADTSGSKNAIQAIGSAVTYLQRYTLLAATGMAAAGADNDGVPAAAATSSMTDEQFITALESIEGAESVNELQRSFAAAYKLAQTAKDKGSMERFIQAKDKRKAELK